MTKEMQKKHKEKTDSDGSEVGEEERGKQKMMWKMREGEDQVGEMEGENEKKKMLYLAD